MFLSRKPNYMTLIWKNISGSVNASIPCQTHTNHRTNILFHSRSVIESFPNYLDLWLFFCSVKARRVGFFFFSFEWRLPCKVWPVSIKVVTSGCHIELDLVEFIKIVDDVGSEVGFEQGTPGVIPVTTWKTNKLLNNKQTTGRFTLIRRQLSFFFSCFLS